MSDLKFTLESVQDFMNKNGGRVKNHELVTHFKSFLNDVHRKDEMRERFKTFVNTLATIKMDEQNEKILVLKKKYRLDSGSVSLDPDRARSEPPVRADKSSSDLTDSVPGRVKSEGNLSASDLRLSASTLTSSNDGTSLGSAQSTSSLSSGNLEDDVNLSVLSVKERAKHLNRMESESELQKTSVSPIAATRINKKDKKVSDGDDSTTSGDFTPLDPLEKEWVVKSSSADYHEMNQLLSKNPKLAKVKDFTTGHTALHWAAKHGRPEVIKLLMGKPGVNVNQRTNGGYTALHLAAQHGHEDIIELLVQGFKADPNIRDYSGKKAKQYLRTSASSRTQRKCNLHINSDHLDAPITTSINLRHSVAGTNPVILRHTERPAISNPQDFRRVKSALISNPVDFRHVQSASFSNVIGGFGPGSLRASVKVEKSPSPAPEEFEKSVELTVTESTEA